jgi:hypothetical protein
MAKEDKIFNNRYNTGEIDFEPFPRMRIDTPDSFDVISEYNGLELQEVLLEIFKKAPFYENYTEIKKIPKGEYCKLFYYFEEELTKSRDMRMMEKFIAVADFMEMNYDILYKEISVKHKESILKEMDEEYGIFKRKKIHRLF